MRALIGRMVPTADGEELATDIFLPGPGKYPIALVRTTYWRQGGHVMAEQFHKHGIGLAYQDVRGKFDSTGSFEPLVYEGIDGHNAIDWLANQSFCDGNVALYGVSYLGIVQVPAASHGHEALRAICPSLNPGSYFRDWIRYDGCFAWGNAVYWLMNHATLPCRTTIDQWDKMAFWNTKDIDKLEQHIEMKMPFLRKWAEHDAYDAFWESIDQDRMHEKIKVPGMHVAGWFDHISRGQYNAYRNITDRGATNLARNNQHLIAGPWGHMNTFKEPDVQRLYGDWDFGEAAGLPVREEEIKFLKYHLRGEDDGFTDQPRVRVFVCGANEWMGFEDWPIPGAVDQTWHLSSNGKANTHQGDGKLSLDQPTAKNEDRYTYDPANPVPTHGGNIYWGNARTGPVDVRQTHDRQDVLVYRSEPVEKPITVVGDITLKLTFSTDVEDTDLIAQFGVEQPSGEMVVLTVGSLRLKYRDSWADPKPLPKNEPVNVSIQLSQIGYRFAPGERIWVSVTSSDFPRILPNTNTMHLFGEYKTASQTVLTGSGAVSCLILPVLPD